MKRCILTAFFVLVTAASALYAQKTADEFFKAAERNLDRRDYKAAIADLTRSIELGYSGKSEAYRSRGSAKYQIGDLKGAEEDLATAIKLSTFPESPLFTRGIIRRETGDYAGSVADFSAMIKLVPSTLAYRERAKSREALGDMDGAIADLTYVMSKGWGNEIEEALLDRGRLYVRKGDRVRGFTDLNKAVDDDPTNYSAYLGRAEVYMSLNELAKAGSDLDMARGLRSDSFSVQHTSGHYFWTVGKYTESYASFTQAIKMEPENAHLYGDRAGASVWFGEYAKALNDLSRATKMNGKTASFYRTRAWANLALGHGIEAYQDSKIALDREKLKGAGKFAVLTGYIGLRKAGEGEKAKAFLNEWMAQAAPAEWTTQIMHFLNGRLTAQRLIAAAGRDQAKLMAAHAYIGEKALLDNSRALALQHFRWVRTSGGNHGYEYHFALTELRNLEGTSAGRPASPKR